MLINNATYQREILSERPIRQPLNSPSQSSLFMKSIVESEIIKIINKFHQHKSIDDISNFILKKVPYQIYHPLAAILNLS